MGVGGAAALATFRLSASEAAQTGPRNVLWVVDDDHPQYMMDSMPVTTQQIRNFRDRLYAWLRGHTAVWTGEGVPAHGPQRDHPQMRHERDLVKIP